MEKVPPWEPRIAGKDVHRVVKYLKRFVLLKNRLWEGVLMKSRHV